MAVARLGGASSPVPPGVMKGSTEKFMRLLLLDLHTTYPSLLHLGQRVHSRAWRATQPLMLYM